MVILSIVAILLISLLLGSLPLIDWITRGLTRKQLAELGTGNLSVSAAFYHGGRWAGILAVLSEAFKGIAAVLLARACFPGIPTWELVALMGVVLGRYVKGRGAGTTNVVWGYGVHDWRAALLIGGIGGVGFAIVRQRRIGRYGILALITAVAVILHGDDRLRILANAFLCLLMAWIYGKIPDDLDLKAAQGQSGSRGVFRFFRGKVVLFSLNDRLDSQKVGQKAATLAQLKRWGYAVPDGWVLPVGEEAEGRLEDIDPSPETPWVVRSSAIGEDEIQASSAGQYRSILGITDRASLDQAILDCRASYQAPVAVQYRRDRQVAETGMAVVIQRQVQGLFSGVAFSRDPLLGHGEAVIVEAVVGAASQVVSGQVTPEQYRVLFQGDQPMVEGEGTVPRSLIEQVAQVVRELESRYQGIPQDIEWAFDGETLWLLQARSITTLWPIWTRKIAAEVIPGLIRPLTWSINQPLTCGVWGEIFKVVLADRATDLDFSATATLHFSHAYFNASLLGDIFLRMGLPPESLEFLTRGAKFSKPPLAATLRNLPGLLRLLHRELSLTQDFDRDDRQHFTSALDRFSQQIPETLTPEALLIRIEEILNLLHRATYYSILAPLSFAFRQALFKVKDEVLDQTQLPEVASLRSLQALAASAREQLPNSIDLSQPDQSLTTWLKTDTIGASVGRSLEALIDRYGYLSEVGTDIAVPTWKEDPKPVEALFAQFVVNLPADRARPMTGTQGPRSVQNRLNLKGRVATVYLKLLAELRWSFVALEHWGRWPEAGRRPSQHLFHQEGDIFFLTFPEIRQWLTTLDEDWQMEIPSRIATRRSALAMDQQLTSIPFVVYGNHPARDMTPTSPLSHSSESTIFYGIGASAGQAEGTVKVLSTLNHLTEIPPNTILVVPYTDAGWAPLLARATGVIAEVGGRLSHGAIVAREYGIPAVMNINQATQLFQDGQQVRIDGYQGIVEILFPRV